LPVAIHMLASLSHRTSTVIVRHPTETVAIGTALNPSATR
jgi:hypothetical protein